MRAGVLRHKIEFVSITATQNESGEPIEGETHYAYAFAEVKPVTGNEKFIANQVFTEATEQIRTRYVSGVTTKHRIVFATRRFDILSAQNKDERNIELLIIAKEIF
jgi:SPP1 family predicted phage head-tail adaptor